MNATTLADLADPPQPRAHQHWASGLVVLVIVFSAIGAVLVTHGNGAAPSSLAASGAPSPGVPSITPAEARDDACACTRRSVAASGTAWRMGLPREHNIAARSAGSGGNLIPTEIAYQGTARTGMWLLHNKDRIERDPRGFLKMMSHLARRHEPMLIRHPGKAPAALRASAIVAAAGDEAALLPTPAPGQDPR